MKLLGNITKDYTVNALKWGYLNKHFGEKFIIGVQFDIGNLLKEKIKRYTGDFSTSVTVEVGQQLLESIYYILDINFIDNFKVDEAVELLKKNSILELYKNGQNNLKNLFEDAKELYERVCKNKYDTELIAYNDTLIEEFGKFFDVYDMEFSPQEIDISVDYPLIFGDLESEGIHYIKNYLETIEIENTFCNYFDCNEIENLLDINAKRYKLNYRDLLTNIFEIVINNTILSILVDEEFDDFYIYKEDLNYLNSNLDRENMIPKVYKAVDIMIEALNIRDSKVLKYIDLYKHRFVEQLKSAVSKNSLECLVVICDEHLQMDQNKNKFIVKENRLDDEDFREILKEIESESNINKKIEIIKNKINSFEDFDDILRSECFYKDEYEILFDSLSEIELAMLGKVVFYEEIEMGKFNLLNEVFKNNEYYHIWHKHYVEYIKNQTIDKIGKIQRNIICLS